MSKRWRGLAWFSTLCCALAVACAAGYYLSWQNGLLGLAERNQQQLEQFVGHIEAQLARFEFLPELIAKNALLVEALNDADNSARINLVNHFLEDINRITGASDTYLMDTNGLTVAASNWQSERPFVGRNFSFRPYFTAAMQGQMGRYFALGTTSGKRGYYFAFPIIWAARVIGAIVIKMDLSNIEQRWSGRATQFVVTDRHGIVFITTQRDWLYQTTRTIDPQTREQIRLSRQYGDINIQSLDIEHEESLASDQSIFTFKTAQPGTGRSYLTLTRPMPDLDWSVSILSPLNEIRRSSLASAVIVLLLGILLIMLGLLLRQQQRRRLEQERFNLDAQRKLEQQVMLRTSDLRNEIEEHKHTEKILRDTRDELIQTAKLAVLGQMSASISHELNNPLAAIRSYADNARQFLQMERGGEVDDNLQRIADLTERMAKISAQLKFFARKSSGKLETVVIEFVIQSAIDVTRPQHKTMPLSINTEPVQPGLSVRADHVQLEQVLVNLISNAVHALEHTPDGEIIISTCRANGFVQLQVEDNGPGIDEAHLPLIFDPFFTTRESGLGLGLSISSRIIDSMNGAMEVSNRPEGGACFKITLPAVE